MGGAPLADPLFVCASNGDGCNQFMNQGVAFDLRPIIAGAADTTMFTSTQRRQAAPPGQTLTRPTAKSAQHVRIFYTKFD